jgi:large subunit ribosomal protein L3
MSIGVVATKCGMTRVFDPDTGVSIPVTVAEVKPNRVVQVKTIESDGYTALQVTSGECKASRLNKPLAGHYAKANVIAGTGLWEFRGTAEECDAISVGNEITASLFEAGQMVDVVGTSKGRGFAGVIRRHNFKSQRASHGNSLSHNAPGSIGQNQSPGRVFKGKKMAGQWGNVRCTVQNLQVVRVDLERNVLLIKGAVPGAPGGRLIICPAVKKKTKSAATAS